jgi:hypothetical protein
MGFADIYDYVDGKLDWLAAGLPTEGVVAALPRADTVARRDVPTCRIDEPIDEVRERVRAAGWDACVWSTTSASCSACSARRSLATRATSRSNA